MHYELYIKIMNHSTKNLVLCFCLLLSSCSGTSHLPKGERLYTGAVVKLETKEKVSKRAVKAVVQDAVRQKPNTGYFGMRPQLCLYMMVGENPKGKFKKWIQKMGEAPVLMSNVKPAATASIIDAKLFNIGIFNSYTQFEVVEKKYTAKVVYTSYIHKPYVIKDLIYAIQDNSISRIILSDKENSLIRAGEDYNLETLKAERIRLDDLLKNWGYFYFNPDYLLFKADTSALNHSVTFKLTLKDSITPEAKTVYHIHNVYINQNYSLQEETTDSMRDTVMYRNTIFKGTRAEQSIHAPVILRSVYLRKNEIYTRENHNITLNRLMSMGNFKFVQVKFSDSDTIPGYLDVTILMTPMSNYTFRAEMDLVSKSNDYTGPKLNLSVLNRNAFNGAELLSLNLAGSFEAQLRSANKDQFSYSWNPQVELTFPHFLAPFKVKPSNSSYVPKTHFLLSYDYLKQINYFDMRTFQFIYGFKWRQNIKAEHEFNPVNVSYTSLSNESDAFTALLHSNPFLKKSYEEQFIAGGSYSYTYNEQVLSEKKIQYYFHVTAETAGNMLSLAKMISGEKPAADNPLTIAGSVYSQYAKLSFEDRTYYNFPDKNKLALRLFAGVAKPFGNSSVIPYSKQFFSGGPNSIRAFQINSVGPGTYDQNSQNLGFLQLGGDIKLEMNGEYRFGIYRFIKGALFVDAGNVWLQKSNFSGIGTPFAFSDFMNELAVGAGLGLRVDVSFFVLRFDLATPLRKPWLDENKRWVINQIDFRSSAWRTDNLVLNIAIGYPF
jgi:outer membrane protein assembly factor BamA